MKRLTVISVVLVAGICVIMGAGAALAGAGDGFYASVEKDLMRWNKQGWRYMVFTDISEESVEKLSDFLAADYGVPVDYVGDETRKGWLLYIINALTEYHFYIEKGDEDMQGIKTKEFNRYMAGLKKNADKHSPGTYPKIKNFTDDYAVFISKYFKDLAKG
jgi:hypothetical protein